MRGGSPLYDMEMCMMRYVLPNEKATTPLDLATALARLDCLLSIPSRGNSERDRDLYLLPPLPKLPDVLDEAFAPSPDEGFAPSPDDCPALLGAAEATLLYLLPPLPEAPELPDAELPP